MPMNDDPNGIGNLLPDNEPNDPQFRDVPISAGQPTNELVDDGHWRHPRHENGVWVKPPPRISAAYTQGAKVLNHLIERTFDLPFPEAVSQLEGVSQLMEHHPEFSEYRAVLDRILEAAPLLLQWRVNLESSWREVDESFRLPFSQAVSALSVLLMNDSTMPEYSYALTRIEGGQNLLRDLFFDLADR